MVHHTWIRTAHLQAELIFSDIPFSGKAYLRAIARRNDRSASAASLAAEAADLLDRARQLAIAHGGRALLAGFRPAGPIDLPEPAGPPAGWSYVTDFIRLTADTRETARRAGQPVQPPGPVTVPGSRPEIPGIRRAPLSEDRIRTYLALHETAMQGVPNVPRLTEPAVRENLAAGHLFLLSQADGTGIGFYELAVDPSSQTADLDEIGLLPEWRGRGIGRMVIGQLAEELAAADIAILAIIVASVNTGALRFYRRLGFGREQLFSRWFSLTLA
jgi:ribosomal protein S18 acetylase RimI-like enzyme